MPDDLLCTLTISINVARNINIYVVPVERAGNLTAVKIELDQVWQRLPSRQTHKTQE